MPQKINNSLIDQINEMKKELNEAEKLKVEAKNLLSNYENKIDKSKKENLNLLNFWQRKVKSSIFVGAKCQTDHLFVTAHIRGLNSKL